ncbi:hypothetical protein HG530_010343 [Fusarium avenaceum]|nr:hypothetical protein HG530_010343 [Fusarium avenaceum]
MTLVVASSMRILGVVGSFAVVATGRGALVASLRIVNNDLNLRLAGGVALRGFDNSSDVVAVLFGDDAGSRLGLDNDGVVLVAILDGLRDNVVVCVLSSDGLDNLLAAIVHSYSRDNLILVSAGSSHNLLVTIVLGDSLDNGVVVTIGVCQCLDLAIVDHSNCVGVGILIVTADNLSDNSPTIVRRSSTGNWMSRANGNCLRAWLVSVAVRVSRISVNVLGNSIPIGLRLSLCHSDNLSRVSDGDGLDGLEPLHSLGKEDIEQWCLVHITSRSAPEPEAPEPKLPRE